MQRINGDGEVVAGCEISLSAASFQQSPNCQKTAIFAHRSYIHDQETDLYYLQSRYYNAKVGRFLNADVYASTGQGVSGHNMFAYCLNNPVTGIDSSGKRTYFINGISNDEESGPPAYADAFAKALMDLGVKDVRTVAAYNGQKGFWGTLTGVAEVACEMVNINVYSHVIAQSILNDLENNPLEEGEQLNLIGYSGGGQLVLNVMEILDGKVDNVILIGAPVAECWNTTTTVSMIYAGWDPLSWNVGWGYNSYFAGWFGHTDYFNSDNIKHVAKIVSKIID